MERDGIPDQLARLEMVFRGSLFFHQLDEFLGQTLGQQGAKNFRALRLQEALDGGAQKTRPWADW